jgi:indole-3-glycerol phosphate synthase
VSSQTPSILARIVAHKRGELEAARRAVPIAELEARARAADPPRGLAAALRRPAGAPVRAIAEIKRASPSAGPIRPGADPAEVAREYQGAGAAAISVLTDQSFFDGHLDFLAQVRAAVSLPLLRKDFLVDPYQVVEARAAGADAILLIASILDADQLRALMGEAARLGLDALVEVHDEGELEMALGAGARLIGVNARDLATFTIDRDLAARLAPRLPGDAVLVAESGIRTAADVQRLGATGAHAVLVGEALMRAASPGAALAAILAGAVGT